MLAEEVVFGRGSEARVAVGRADHPEFVWIDTEFLLELETDLQRRPGVLVLQHVLFFGHTEVEVALVPGLVVGKLVVGRQEGVGLAIPFDLGGFVKRLPLVAGRCVLEIDGFAGEGLDDREHDAVGEVAVMGDGQHLAAGLVLVCLHPVPQVARVVAALRLQRGVRLHHAGPLTVIAVNQNPVEIVAASVRCPLPADKGGELAGLVVLLGRIDGLVPGRAVGRGAWP